MGISVRPWKPEDRSLFRKLEDELKQQQEERKQRKKNGDVKWRKPKQLADGSEGGTGSRHPAHTP